MEEELKKENDFRKTCRSILPRFYRNTSNGITTHNLTTTDSWIFYINSVIKFNLNNYFLNSLFSLLITFCGICNLCVFAM